MKFTMTATQTGIKQYGTTFLLTIIPNDKEYQFMSINELYEEYLNQSDNSSFNNHSDHHSDWGHDHNDHTDGHYDYGAYDTHEDSHSDGSHNDSHSDSDNYPF